MPKRLSRRQIATHFAELLVFNHRVRELDQIMAEIDQILSEKGHITARVTSARDLDADVRRAVMQLVSKHTGSENIQLECAVDEALIGGVRVAFAGYEVDQSVATKIKALNSIKEV
jgi:ATP synthase F1 delta subunit